MKKILVVAMMTLVGATMFTGCAAGDTTEQTATPTPGAEASVQKEPLQDMLAKMIEAGAVRMPLEVDDTLATEHYKVDLENVEEYAIAQTGISPGPGLVVMVKAKEGQVEAAKANMEALLDAQIGNAFYPEEKEIAENAEIIVDGDYVALFLIHDDFREATMAIFEGREVE